MTNTKISILKTPPNPPFKSPSIHSVSVEDAKLAVEKSNEQLSAAFDQLKFRMEGGVKKIEKYAQAAKNPLLLMGITFVFGMFLGQMIKLPASKR